MSITINGFTNVVYCFLDLNEVNDTQKLYYNMLDYHRTGELINMIKSHDTLHLIFKDKESFTEIVNKEFLNPKLISQEDF